MRTLTELAEGQRDPERWSTGVLRRVAAHDSSTRGDEFVPGITDKETRKGFRVRCTSTPEADLVIGDWTLSATPRQALLQVDDQTVRYVTPTLLTYLEQQNLLQPGTVLVVGRLIQGDFGEALLIFV